MPRKLQSFSLLLLLFILPALSQTALVTPAATEARVDSMLKQLTLEEKIDLLGGVDDFYIRAIPRIGLPRLKMADGPLGVRNYGPSTVFGGIGLAATWDPALAQRIGAVIGEDARSRGVHFMLGPGVNIYRAPCAAETSNTSVKIPSSPLAPPSPTSKACKARESAPPSSTSWATTRNTTATISIPSSTSAPCAKSICRSSKPQ